MQTPVVKVIKANPYSLRNNSLSLDDYWNPIYKRSILSQYSYKLFTKLDKLIERFPFITIFHFIFVFRYKSRNSQSCGYANNCQ